MLIGSQSNFSCVKDEKSSKPQLEYVSTKYVIFLRLSKYCELKQERIMSCCQDLGLLSSYFRDHRNRIRLGHMTRYQKEIKRDYLHRLLLG